MARSSRPDAADHVMTVLGPVRPQSIGPTLMHEHIFMDSRWFRPDAGSGSGDADEAPFGAMQNGLARWNSVDFPADLHFSPDEMQTMLDEVGHFAAAGGSCLVELTIQGIGPQPRCLQEVSRQLGVHIVEGCGFYVHASHPEWVERASTEELADFLEQEVREGVDGSDVLPGIIGEIGTSEDLFACEERMLQAAARVGRTTGTAVNIHCNPPPKEVTLRILDILMAEGLDPSRIYLSHLDEIADLEYHVAVMERGVTTGFDSFGQEGYFSPDWRALTDLEKMQTMVVLIERGYEDQLVVAQDICKKHHLHAYGGLGYDHVMRRVVPRLKEVFGITDAVIDKLLVQNPRRLLTRPGTALA